MMQLFDQVMSCDVRVKGGTTDEAFQELPLVQTLDFLTFKNFLLAQTLSQCSI